MLLKTHDSVDAWAYYQRAITDRPADPTALDAAGRLAYVSGDFEDAHRLLARALEDKATLSLDPKADNLMQQAGRIVELTPSQSLPPRERADRILAARSIARKRFVSCSADIRRRAAPS